MPRLRGADDRWHSSTRSPDHLQAHTGLDLHEPPSRTAARNNQTPEQKKCSSTRRRPRPHPRSVQDLDPLATVISGMEHIGTYLNKKGSLSEREVEIGIWSSRSTGTPTMSGRRTSRWAAGRAVPGRHRRGAGEPRSKLTDPHERARSIVSPRLSVAGAKLRCRVCRD